MSLSHEKEKRERREREGSSPIFLSQKKKWSWCWKEFEKWKRKWASFYFFQEILNSLLNHNSKNLKISQRFFLVNKLLITSRSYKSTDDNLLPLNLAVKPETLGSAICFARLKYRVCWRLMFWAKCLIQTQVELIPTRDLIWPLKIVLNGNIFGQQNKRKNSQNKFNSSIVYP